MVSGVLVLAKTKQFAAVMTEAFNNPGTLKKEYLARVQGHFPPGIHRVDAPLRTFAVFSFSFRSTNIIGL